MSCGHTVRLSLAGVVVTGLLFVARVCKACDTPVYAYTMQMWVPDPYRVFYFHNGREDPADAAVNRLLAEAAEDPDGKANLRFTSVAVTNLSETSAAGKVFERNRSRTLPFHVVVSPRGLDITAERLTVATAKAILHSPQRARLSELLCSGKHGVLVLLIGSNADEAERARVAVRTAMAQAAEGGADVGLLEIKRDDPTEKWFVRQMLAVEDDLKDLPQTMLFGVFGRGHILEPFVGRGISRENVLDLIGFMGGPCACEVKEIAPGTDLLITCNWNQAAVEWDPSMGYAEIPYEPLPTKHTPETPKPASEPESPAKAAPESSAAKAPSEEPSRAVAAESARGKRSLPTKATAQRKRPVESTTKQRGPNLEPPAVSASPPAEAQAAMLDETSRGPALPSAPVTVPTMQSERSVTSRLGVKLGIAVGVLTLSVVIGGLALLWVRREQ